MTDSKINPQVREQAERLLNALDRVAPRNELSGGPNPNQTQISSAASQQAALVSVSDSARELAKSAREITQQLDAEESSGADDRAKRVAALKAQYQDGDLKVDTKRTAAAFFARAVTGTL